MKVSIGLPVYNNAATLAKTLKSIFAQTLRDWELIVVDDGSHDGSLPLLDSIDDPRVRVFSDGMNRGLAARLNQIASLASCDLLARMDADDMMHPERLQRQVDFLAEHPEVDLVGSAIYSIDNNDQVQGIGNDRALDREPSTVLRRARFVHPTVMGRKEWFLNNPYDEQLRRAQDRELWYRTMPHTVAAILTTPLLFYREHEVSFEEYDRHLAADRVILALHGPSLLGRGGTALQLLRSRLKGWACRAACSLGGGRYLVRRRNRRPLLPEEHAVAANGLAVVLATEVPGVGRSRPESRAA